MTVVDRCLYLVLMMYINNVRRNIFVEARKNIINKVNPLHHPYLANTTISAANVMHITSPNKQKSNQTGRVIPMLVSVSTLISRSTYISSSSKNDQLSNTETGNHATPTNNYKSVPTREQSATPQLFPTGIAFSTKLPCHFHG